MAVAVLNEKCMHIERKDNMTRHLSPEIRVPIDPDNPSIERHEELCIRCGKCRDVCRDEISVLTYYDLAKTGDVPICINCGQCANVCPVNSITEKSEVDALKKAIADPEKVVIVSTSPSVRVSLGEGFNEVPGTFSEGKMVALLRALGADIVLDTDFAADMTIVEEASELLSRVTKKSAPLPQFTSCCPAWVKFAETYYPELLPHISSAKSPIGMQGPTIKTWYAKKRGIDPKKIVNVCLTPCTAKKFEIRREEMNDSASYWNEPSLRDMDLCITTRELISWAKEAGTELDQGDPPVIAEGSTGGWYVKPATMYAIASNTAHPEAAAKLFNYLVNDADMAKLQGTEKGIPVSSKARKVLQDNDMIKGLDGEAGSYVLDHLDSMKLMNPSLEDSDLISAFIDEAEKYYYGKADLDTCTKETADAWAGILSRQ